MIRSSKLSIKFSNSGKLGKVDLFIDEYQSVVRQFVELLWKEKKVKSLLPDEITSKVSSWLSARAIQCAGKQASGIVRGTRAKQKKRLWKINDFNERGMFKKARTLQKIYDKTVVSMPVINTVCPELDERFVKQDFQNSTSFDGWITLSSLGNKIKIPIPVKQTKHFNQMSGTRLKGIRLNKKWIAFNFDIPDIQKRTEGSILGIDIGKKTALSCSNGVTSKEDIHGWTLNKIIDKMAHKKKGSKTFKRVQTHRTNHVNWVVNQLNLNDVKQINIEKIKYLRKGVRTNRKLSHWTYTEIFTKLKSKSDELGVQVNELNPAYTSQRCSVCGWVRNDNRKGKLFKCKSCGYTQDADLNASSNLSLNLLPLSKAERLILKNRNGFYWNASDQQPIVADTLLA
jgi:IS605 OrfB family transposase